jgi:hypothetical protein
MEEVGDARCEPARMQAQAQDVDRRLEERRVDAFIELRQGAVRRHHVPVPVLLVTAGWVEPSVLGYAFVLAQAGAVAVLAVLEHAAYARI